jgi:hypothetical protein
MPKEKKHNIFLYVLLISVIISIASSFYFFYFKRDFNFIVETKCNPETETCFYRDCTINDNCPSDNLSYYNTYTIKASDFKYCTDEDCTSACKTGVILCKKTECTEKEFTDGTCVAPISINTN